MNILFDIVSLQGYHNGGEEYVRAVLKRLMTSAGIRLYGIYDSRLKFLDEDERWLGETVHLLDIRENRIADIIVRYKIDKLFIGIGQRYGRYDLRGIECEAVCVIHDVADYEFATGIYKFFLHRRVKDIIRFFSSPSSLFSYISAVNRSYMRLKIFLGQKNVELVTVSEYTKNALYYYIPELMGKEIRVLYPPRKYAPVIDETVGNFRLASLLQSGRPYILLLSANRFNKNADFFLKVFRKFQGSDNGYSVVLTGVPEDRSTDTILAFKYLSATDVEQAYKNAYALAYPSCLEGFGYPPIEAMKYGTPVLSANVCSMPEILGDAAVFFSPFHESDLYRSFFTLQDHYEEYRERSLRQYSDISRLMEADFDALIELILR